MIIGTAGHIDHGKSELVKALTGRSMDRLKEERRRGITIDLNFAPFQVADGPCAGIIDVPGHEDFVRTMVAGASGIDLVLLVVDATEGPRPQTYEHLGIVEQLGIRKGIPVLTKIDLVDSEWLALVEAEVEQLAKRSPIEFAPVAPVSARTGEGIEDLKVRIQRIVEEWHPSRDEDLFRMPVDRAFSLTGVGTVVTGTVWSGSVETGETVLVLPGGFRGRIRSLERFGETVEQAEAGHRHAMALAGVDRETIARGKTVVRAGDEWQETTVLDVTVRIEAGADRGLGPRTRVRLHLGTTEVLARVYPRDPLPPGGEGKARLVLEDPTVARGGDRFVLRRYSPAATIGGGVVLDPMPRRRARWHPGLNGNLEERVDALLRRWPEGVSGGRAPILLGLAPRRAWEAFENHTGSLRLDGRWFSRLMVERGRERALAAIGEYHAVNPASPGMSQETLRQAIRSPQAVSEEVLGRLIGEGVIVVEDGIVRARGFRPTVAGGEAAVDEIVGCIQDAGFAPPSLGELEARGGKSDVADTIRLAVLDGRLVQVERDRWFARPVLDRFVVILGEVAAENGGGITPAAVRERTDLSRKFLIPLLEWSDREGVTRRVGDKRVLCG